MYDNLGKIAAEYDGSGNVLRDYAYLSREIAPVSTWEANGHINYLQHDRLGTLVALSGGGPGSATLITNWYAQPDYGTTDLFTAGVTFGYAGYYFDQETGLYKTASRYYDPRLGRFITPDPIGQQGGLNIYAYVNNDPLNLTDPSGLCAQIGCGIANAALSLLQNLNPISTAEAATGSYSTPGGFTYGDKIQAQMGPRGFTSEQIDEAVQSGDRIDAINKATGGPATRYINPTTGQSVVIDNTTHEVIQVGGPGFKFGPESGDVPGAQIRSAPPIDAAPEIPEIPGLPPGTTIPDIPE